MSGFCEFLSDVLMAVMPGQVPALTAHRRHVVDMPRSVLVARHIAALLPCFPSCRWGV